MSLRRQLRDVPRELLQPNDSPPSTLSTFASTLVDISNLRRQAWVEISTPYLRRRFGTPVALTKVGLRAYMFRISTIDTPSKRRLLVEGRLTEPWITELRRTWNLALRELDGRKLVIDLSNVTVISRDGEDAIHELMNDGAKFSCGGVFNRHILTQLSRTCRRMSQPAPRDE